MILRDGKCCADDAKPVMRITSASLAGPYSIRVVFNNEESRLFDGTQLFSGEVFAPLKDADVFSDFKLDYETLTWQDGDIDVAPEFVYSHSTL